MKPAQVAISRILQVAIFTLASGLSLASSKAYDQCISTATDIAASEERIRQMCNGAWAVITPFEWWGLGIVFAGWVMLTYSTPKKKPTRRWPTL